jgi:hypothetical protein
MLPVHPGCIGNHRARHLTTTHIMVCWDRDWAVNGSLFRHDKTCNDTGQVGSG